MDVAERSEDLLTDAVFGALRHLPYDKALSAVLARVGVAVTDDEARDCEVLLWPQIPLSGWRGKVIEPDVIVRVGSRLVVFEARVVLAVRHELPGPEQRCAQGPAPARGAAPRSVSLGGRLRTEAGARRRSDGFSAAALGGPGPSPE